MNSDQKLVKINLFDLQDNYEGLNTGNADDCTNLITKRVDSNLHVTKSIRGNINQEPISEKLILKQNKNRKMKSNIDIPLIEEKKGTFFSDSKSGCKNLEHKENFVLNQDKPNLRLEMKQLRNKKISSRQNMIKSLEFNILGTPLKGTFRLETEVATNNLKRFHEEYNIKTVDKNYMKNDTNYEYFKKGSKGSIDKVKKKRSVISEDELSHINIFHNKQKFYSSMITFFVLLNLALNIVDISFYVKSFDEHLETFFKPSDLRVYTIDMFERIKHREATVKEITVRLSNYCVIFMLDLCVVLLYQVELDITKYYRNCEEDSTIFSLGILKKLILEMTVLSIFFPSEYLIITDYNDKRYLYTLNAFICIISTVKIYVIGNSLVHFSKWRENSNIVICKKYHVNPDLGFVNQAMFKQHLILFNMVTFFLSVFYLGFLLWCFDLGIFVLIDKDRYMKINDYDISTCIFIILETCTTLGYGELVQSSYTGRFIAISSVIFGWACLSLIIVFSFRKLDFDEDEVKAFYEYKKREIKEITEKKAINVIKFFIKFRYLLLTKKTQYKFLNDEENYDYENFVRFRIKTRKSSFNNTKMKVITDKPNGNEIMRFYNKIFCYNTLYSLIVNFTKSNRVLKCYLPTLEVKMQNFISAIDENYKKMTEIITNLEEAGKEFQIQVQESKLSLSRMIQIGKVQNKIAKFFIKKNNFNFMKKFGKSLVDKDLMYTRSSCDFDPENSKN